MQSIVHLSQTVKRLTGASFISSGTWQVFAELFLCGQHFNSSHLKLTFYPSFIFILYFRGTYVFCCISIKDTIGWANSWFVIVLNQKKLKIKASCSWSPYNICGITSISGTQLALNYFSLNGRAASDSDWTYYVHNGEDQVCRSKNRLVMSPHSNKFLFLAQGMCSPELLLNWCCLLIPLCMCSHNIRTVESLVNWCWL